MYLFGPKVAILKKNSKVRIYFRDLKLQMRKKLKLICRLMLSQYDWITVLLQKKDLKWELGLKLIQKCFNKEN